MRFPFPVFLLLSVALFFSCSPRDHTQFMFQPVPSDGWEQTDTIRFPLDTIRQGGTYAISIALRTATPMPYPYRSLTLTLRERITPMPERELSVRINLDETPTTFKSRGISMQQYIMCADTLHLPAGNAFGELLVVQAMQSRLLRGIRDVGIRLEKI